MDVLPALLLFSLSAAFTPGPNNIMIMSSGLNFGMRRSIPHLLGICLGFPAMLIVVGFSAGYLFETFPHLHLAIKIIGLSYLCYLAWRIATAAPGSLQGGRSKPLSFLQAALFQWVNPKAWIMGTSAFATYTTVGGDLSSQTIMIILVFFVTTWPAVGTWLFFGAGLQKLMHNPLHQRIFNVVMAILLVASMYAIIVELILQLVR